MKFVWIRIPFASSLLLIPAHLARCYYLAWYAKECTACLQNQRYNRREFRRGGVQRHYPSLPLYVPTFIFKEKIRLLANVILKSLKWKLSFLLSSIISICFSPSTQHESFLIFSLNLCFLQTRTMFAFQFVCTSTVHQLLLPTRKNLTQQRLVE